MPKLKYLKVIKDPVLYDKDSGMLIYLYRGYRVKKSDILSHLPFSVGKMNFVTLKEAKIYIDEMCDKENILYKSYIYFDFKKGIEVSIYNTKDLIC